MMTPEDEGCPQCGLRLVTDRNIMVTYHAATGAPVCPTAECNGPRDCSGTASACLHCYPALPDYGWHPVDNGKDAGTHDVTTDDGANRGEPNE